MSSSVGSDTQPAGAARSGGEPWPGSAPGSLGRGYFDEFYAGRDDPWGFTSRWYEERKRALTLAVLPRRRFTSVFEPGCSIGVLTADLALRCDALLATDIAAAPLRVARKRLRDNPHVRFEQRTVPQDWPPGSFDLVVLSEMAYYCSDLDLDELIRRARSSLTADGVLLLCHWRHPVSEYPQSGDEVHRRALADRGLTRLAGYLDDDVRVDVLVRPPARSVAAQEGLA